MKNATFFGKRGVTTKKISLLKTLTQHAQRFPSLSGEVMMEVCTVAWICTFFLCNYLSENMVQAMHTQRWTLLFPPLRVLSSPCLRICFLLLFKMFFTTRVFNQFPRFLNGQKVAANASFLLRYVSAHLAVPSAHQIRSFLTKIRQNLLVPVVFSSLCTRGCIPRKQPHPHIYSTYSWFSVLFSLFHRFCAFVCLFE